MNNFYTLLLGFAVGPAFTYHVIGHEDSADAGAWLVVYLVLGRALIQGGASLADRLKWWWRGRYGDEMDDRPVKYVQFPPRSVPEQQAPATRRCDSCNAALPKDWYMATCEYCLDPGPPYS